MKIILALPILLFFNLIVNAQSIDNNDIPIEEYLVAIAWDNSAIRKTNISTSDIIETDIKFNKFSWLDGVWIGSNINEYTINPPESGNNFYPRYNFGYRLSYGQVTESISNSKKNKKEIEIISYKNDSDSIELRAAVLRNYKTFLLTKELYQMEKEKLININSELEIVEKEFTDGKQDITAYNTFLNELQLVKGNVLKAEYQHSLAKIDLEKLLGSTLEDVFNITTDL